MSNHRNYVPSPPDYHLSPNFSQHMNTLIFIVPPQTSPKYCFNTVFSSILSSRRPPYVPTRSQIFPRVFATHHGSYSKKAPSTQIMSFRTLPTSSSSPCPETTMNPSANTPKLPSIALLTGGYRFSRGITNWKRHETHESCSSIRTLV